MESVDQSWTNFVVSRSAARGCWGPVWCANGGARRARDVVQIPGLARRRGLSRDRPVVPPGSRTQRRRDPIGSREIDWVRAARVRAKGARGELGQAKGRLPLTPPRRRFPGGG